MTTNNTTSADWSRADLVLGLGADLLPIVPADSTPAGYSKVKAFGKMPSEFNPDGQVHGIKGWPTRDILPEHLARWSQEPRYSLCVRSKAIRAIDVDVDGADSVAEELSRAIDALIPASYPRRRRANSRKFLVPFRLAVPLSKRIINTARGRIELLADGQQFLLAGMHPSGVRYEWSGESGTKQRLPDDIPTITLEQLESLWSAFTKFAVSTSTPEQPKGQVIAPDTAEVLTAIPDDARSALDEALHFKPLLEAAKDNTVWSEVGYALLSIGQLGYELWHMFSQLAPGYTFEAPRDWWDQHSSQTPRSDWRHIITMARRYGMGREPAPIGMFPVHEVQPDTAPDAQQPATAADGEPLIADAPEKPIFKLIGGNLHNEIEQALELLDGVYAHGEHLVRFGNVRTTGYRLARDPNAQPLVEATTAYLRAELTRRATIMMYDGRTEAWKVVNCPKDFADVIAGQKWWGDSRVLNGVVRAPFFREDGSLCTNLGYDEKSGVMYIRSIDFPAIPDSVTKSDARAALDLLQQPFREFPFSARNSKSAFLAHILTEVSRTAMPTSPMFFYTASTPGTGKTLLAQIPSLIAHGLLPATRPWVDGEELRKTLYTALLAGDKSVYFDNIPNGTRLRSPGLCMFITSAIYSDRTLGQSTERRLPNQTVVTATGNNITPTGDLARRSLVVRMDANMDPAALRARTFIINDLRTHVHDRRAELFIAAMTVVRGFQQSGVKTPGNILPSFEAWSTLVRNALIWLGEADPVETQEAETDDETGSLAYVFETLHGMLQHKPYFAARDIVEACGMLVDPEGRLLAALQATGCSNPADVVKVGYWLRSNRDRVANGFKLVSGKKEMTGVTWKIASMSSGEDLI